MSAGVKHRDVAVGIIWRADFFLASRRPPGYPMPGRWEFPGGKIEPGESPAAALERELEEEIGIRVERASFWKIFEHAYAAKNLHVSLHFFHVLRFHNEPAPLEGQGLCWVRPLEALNMDFLAADRVVLEELEQLHFSGNEACLKTL
ncbi:MAG: (deoxy)nucleoside triphosphate pyrophosphohydrolase [Desulfovibrio sp.]|jgi:8-oxo-dGTP diphosphatase|nr:(deoxy)nucleoside triphosphate pyrophosphohydrolase [Desulfovibrio sp.]